MEGGWREDGGRMEGGGRMETWGFSLSQDFWSLQAETDRKKFQLLMGILESEGSGNIGEANTSTMGKCGTSNT